MSKLRMLGNRVLVKAEEVSNTTASGLHVVHSEDDSKPSKGTVVSAGPDTSLNQGDYILFGKYSATPIEVENETLLMLIEDDIMATLQ